MRASGYERAASDWYVEPDWTVRAVVEAERLTPSHRCYDPSCGGGNIPRTLNAMGIGCGGSDIVDRGYGPQRDFFASTKPTSIIISNPPYGVISDYVRHALTLVDDRVILLARLALLEGQKRAILDDMPFARCWVSKRRISMPPGGSDVPAKGGSIAYAWFVWQVGHVGPATVGRI